MTSAHGERALTLEAWALAYIQSTSLTYKLSPQELPEEGGASPRPLRCTKPGRPPELQVSWIKYKAPKTAHALTSPKKRAHLLHTFFHHELQAAELMCWAVLAFPDTPLAFRRGLLRICLDEVRHMRMYAAHLDALGFALGSFPVRDWFWERAPQARCAAEFVALMGLGFEAGNLDHTARFAAMFRAAGDERGARLQEHVGKEEIAHVAFGAHWFAQFRGELSFSAWETALPAPLSPMLMRGFPIQRGARAEAGMTPDFLDELEAWRPRLPGC